MRFKQKKTDFHSFGAVRAVTVRVVILAKSSRKGNNGWL